MAHELFMYILLIIMGGALSLCLCVYAFFRLKTAPGGKYYIAATFLEAVFNFAYLFELTSPSLDLIKFWLRIEYLPLPFIPFVTLLMCCEYVGLRIKRWLFPLLLFIPLTTILMQSTNDFHYLYYTSVGLHENAPFPIVQLEHGPYFYVHFVYLHGCIGASVFILLWQLRKVSIRFRMQMLTMVAGLITPVVASFFYVDGRSPYGIDLGPVFISFSSVFHSIALLRYQMFNVAPIARDIVFESMEEGVLVLNEHDLIVDYNQAAAQVISSLNSKAIGQSIQTILQGNEELQKIVEQAKECDYAWRRGGVTLHHHIRFSPVRNKQDVQVGKIVTFVNITQRVTMEEQLKRLASTDSLTQLLNKAALMDKSEQLLQDLTHTGGSASVIMFDIDRFKRINDTYGHEAGDLALMFIASVTRECLGEIGMAGRYGGDEFIIFLPQTNERAACELADHIRRKVAKRELVLGEERVRITSSFGVVHVELNLGDQPPSMKMLVRQADQALYAAKRLGRNCVEAYKRLAPVESVLDRTE